MTSLQLTHVLVVSFLVFTSGLHGKHEDDVLEELKKIVSSLAAVRDSLVEEEHFPHNETQFMSNKTLGDVIPGKVVPRALRDSLSLNYYDFNKMEVVYPEGGFGFIKLKETYKKQEPQCGGSEVQVSLTVRGISRIDTWQRRLGLEIESILTWEDRRVTWPVREPGCQEVFELSPSVLR